MSDVFVERHWPAGLSEADMHQLMEIADSCLGLHRVSWIGSMLSADGRELLCHFRGPDAESVRIAAQQPGMPRGPVWACTVHDAPGLTPALLAQTNVAVTHRFERPAPVGDLAAEAGLLADHGVQLLRRHVATDGRRWVSVLHAPDTASAAMAMQHAGLPVDGLWAVRRFAP